MHEDAQTAHSKKITLKSPIFKLYLPDTKAINHIYRKCLKLFLMLTLLGKSGSQILKTHVSLGVQSESEARESKFGHWGGFSNLPSPRKCVNRRKDLVVDTHGVAILERYDM